ALPVVAPAQYNYSINPDLTVSLTGYTGTDLSVSVPSQINGLRVTVLSYTFYASRVTSVFVPDTVVVIDSAFYGCPGLTNVTLGRSVARVGDYSFANCTSLPNVTIPDSATNIGYGVFSDSIGLTNVNIGKAVASIGSPSFSGSSNLL